MLAGERKDVLPVFMGVVLFPRVAPTKDIRTGIIQFGLYSEFLT